MFVYCFKSVSLEALWPTFFLVCMFSQLLTFPAKHSFPSYTLWFMKRELACFLYVSLKVLLKKPSWFFEEDVNFFNVLYCCKFRQNGGIYFIIGLTLFRMDVSRYFGWTSHDMTMMPLSLMGIVYCLLLFCLFFFHNFSHYYCIKEQ